MRAQIADEALTDMIAWLKQSGHQIGIYDASNIEASRRRHVYDRLRREGIQVLFVETICDRPEIINVNIRDIKLTSPDYAERYGA